MDIGCWLLDIGYLHIQHIIQGLSPIPSTELCASAALREKNIPCIIQGLSPIPSTSVKHVEEAVSALDITLSPEEIAALEAPYVPPPP